jgi:hypothetical protein
MSCSSRNRSEFGYRYRSEILQDGSEIRQSISNRDAAHVMALEAADGILRRHFSLSSSRGSRSSMSSLHVPDGHIMGRTISGEKVRLVLEGDTDEEFDFATLDAWLENLNRRSSSTDVIGISDSESTSMVRDVVTVKLLKALEKLGEWIITI